MPPRRSSRRNQRQDDIKRAQELIDNNGNLNEVNVYGETPLYIACEEGNIELVRLLVDAGADLNKANGYGATPLYIACNFGHLEVVRLLVDAGADKNDARNGGATPLWIASYMGRIEIVRLLVEAGADVDKADRYGETPLYIASQKGHIEVVRLLIEAGADKEKPLLIASNKGHLDVVRLLVDAGADKDTADDYGETPLYIASHEGRLEVVRLLVDAGADVNKADYDRMTPLHVACLYGPLEIVRLLVVAGADIAKKDKYGNTPLDIAVNNDHTDIIDYLLSTSINKNLNIKHPRVEAFKKLKKKREEFLKKLGDTEKTQKKKIVKFLSKVCYNNATEILTQEWWNTFNLEDLLKVILYEPISKEVLYISDLDISNRIKHHCYDGESLVNNIKTIEGNERDGLNVADVGDPMTRNPYTQNNIIKIKNNLFGGSKNTNKTLEIYIPNSIKTIKKLKYKKNTPFDGLQKIGTLVVSKSLLKKKDSTKKQPTKTKESTKKQPTKTKESTKKQPTKTK